MTATGGNGAEPRTRKSGKPQHEAAACSSASFARGSMIFSDNRFPSRIKSGTGFFGIMLYEVKPS
jgi:hypothetical protein